MTLPVWLVMVTLSELGIGPRFAAGSEGRRPWSGRLYAAALWIVWVVFLLGTASGHLIAYNLPALHGWAVAVERWPEPSSEFMR